MSASKDLWKENVTRCGKEVWSCTATWALVWFLPGFCSTRQVRLWEMIYGTTQKSWENFDVFLRLLTPRSCGLLRIKASISMGKNWKFWLKRVFMDLSSVVWRSCFDLVGRSPPNLSLHGVEGCEGHYPQDMRWRKYSPERTTKGDVWWIVLVDWSLKEYEIQISNALNILSMCHVHF